MKLKTKLLLGLSALPILIFLLIGVSWFQLSKLKDTNTTLQTNYDIVYLAEQIHRGVKNEAISLRNIALFTDQSLIENELAILQQESDAVTNNAALLDSKLTTSEFKPMIIDLIHTNDKFNDYKDRLVELVNAGKKEEALYLINNESHVLHEEFFQKISTLTTTFENRMDSSLSNMSSDFRQNIITSGIISIIALIIVIGFVFRNVWTIAFRLKNVSDVMYSIANGSADLGTKVEVNSNDEIDEVGNSFNKMVESLEEQKHKEHSLLWVKSNVAEITTGLTGMHDLDALAQTFLSKIAPLTEAAHAVFYMKDDYDNEGKPNYKLLATYAYKERKHLLTSFRLGEGLVGQAAFEKTPIILNNVPSDYIKVTSGLGELPPLTVYVLPVSFENDVKAVVEFASFKPFDTDQQTLLEELTNGLGIILESVMGRRRLARLLEEAQMLTEEVQAQSEELQSQQEELRMTNEELEEQTQALRQSEEKLQLQQEELEQTNFELKEKAESLEVQNQILEQTNMEVENARVELEEKAKQLALSSKYKSEFLANMSHELRTPLNSLLILSKLLSDNRDGNLTDKQVEYSKTVYSSGSDLLILINDILDLAKIESGKVEINPSQISINDIAEIIEKSFRPIANEKQLSFDIVVKEGIQNSVYTDGKRLQQVLKNLLSNAFKFTHHGGVTLEINSTIDSNNIPLFVFSIIDSGIGVPKDKQDLIFEAFQQADGTTSRKYGGTGLGLSICREIATMLGGQIVVESEEGIGSKFIFNVGDYQEKILYKETSNYLGEVAVTRELPTMKQEETTSLSKVSEPKQIQYLNSSNEIKRVLIVDDDMKQRASLMELIAEKDVIIKAVSSGAEALEELKLGQVDCMILDLGLKDTTGFALLEKIKSKVEDENIKVIIYTGRDLTSKEEIYLNKYAHTIIIKDAFSAQRLDDELELFLHSNHDRVDTINQSISVQKQILPSLEGKNVLVVDDDVRNVFALSSILEQYGMNVKFAENGIEGLDLLEKYSDFEIVLMDIMMPEMDGYEAIQRIRENPTFEHLPVIALTAKAMKEDREKCMEVGASDYIMKPVDPDQLISLIRVWLYQQEGNNL